MSCDQPLDIAAVSCTAEPSGLRYPPTPNGKKYLSVYYHRAMRPTHKSTWSPSVSPTQEYHVFWCADCGDWLHVDGSLWGIADRGNAELGTRGQRLCFFPRPSNTTDVWHGYPLSPADDGRDPPPDSLVDKWENDGTVTRTWASRLRRGVV